MYKFIGFCIMFIGFAVILIGVPFSVYYLFIGGIVDIIREIKSPVVNEMNIAFGVLKVLILNQIFIYFSVAGGIVVTAFGTWVYDK